MARYELTDFEWQIIQPLLPNKPRGVPRVDDRRVMNGIFWIVRSGAPWRDLPERYGPYTTVYNRFNRWRKVGVWDRLMDAVTASNNSAASPRVMTVSPRHISPWSSSPPPDFGYGLMSPQPSFNPEGNFVLYWHDVNRRSLGIIC